jgi:predicted ATPase
VSAARHSESIVGFVPALELLITEAMDEWKIPGLAVVVVQNGEVALVRAYGLRDVEAGLKVTTDTQFLIGSITKSFTSMGLALLVDERRLDWKQPVRDYIPEFRLHDAVATDRITVRDLLCHHSGLPRHDWIWVPGDLSPAQMLAAVRYWLKAGEQAAARSANKEAVSHLKTGIELLGGAPDTAEKPRLDLDLHSALASVLMVTQGYGSEEVGRISTRTVELCRQVGDEDALAAVLWQAWLFNYTRADHAAATAIGRELEERMTDAVDPAARIVAHVPLGLSLFATGKPLEARAKLEHAVLTYSGLKGGPVAYRYGMEVGAVAHGYRAWCLGMLGYPEQAIEGRGVLLEILERINHPFTLARGLNWCSMVSVVQKDWRGALLFADRAIKVAREYDLQLVVALGLAMRGIAQAAVEPVAASTAAMRDALDMYRRTGARFQAPFLLSLFAEASLARENWTDGISAISEALSLIEETGEAHVVPEVYRIRGDLLVDSTKGDSEADYLKALELARLQGTRLFELRAAMSLASLWADQRKRAEARDLLLPIYDWFTEGFSTPDLKSAKEQLERLN